MVDYTTAAVAVQMSLGDANRTRAFFTKAQGACKVFGDFDVCVRAALQIEGFGDVAREGFAAAEGKLADARELKCLADGVLTRLDDRDWARRIYQKALQAQNADRWRSDIMISVKNRLGDDEWAVKLARQL